MQIEKLKKILIICVSLIIILIIFTSIDFEKIKQEKDVETNSQSINVANIHKFDKIDYNNLTEAQRDYLEDKYGSTSVRFTLDGVSVYYGNAISSKVERIITSKWPSKDIGNLIPNPESYGELDRIEYSENWIKVYIENAKKSDAKNYLKLLKKYDFTQNEEKEEGEFALQYKIYDAKGNSVKITFFKSNNTLEIEAREIN